MRKEVGGRRQGEEGGGRRSQVGGRREEGGGRREDSGGIVLAPWAAEEGLRREERGRSRHNMVLFPDPEITP